VIESVCKSVYEWFCKSARECLKEQRSYYMKVRVSVCVRMCVQKCAGRVREKNVPESAMLI
jgi:hypothetical protein